MAVLSLLILIFVISYGYEIRDKKKAEFIALSEEAVSEIENRLDRNIAILRGSAGFVSVNEQVSKDEFKRFAAELGLQRNFPALDGIGYVRRLTQDEIDAFVLQRRLEDENYTMTPKTSRSDYYPIVYLEPETERNNRALGYDMFTEKTRRDAMERARDSGAVALSSAVILKQEATSFKTGFLLYYPVYRIPSPSTTEQRRTFLSGYIYSPLQAKSFFSRSTAKYGSRIAYTVASTNKFHDTLLYSSNLHRAENIFQRPWFEYRRLLTLGGTTWIITFYSTSLIASLGDLVALPQLMAIGIIFCIIIYVFTWRLYSAKRTAQDVSLHLAALERRSKLLLEISRLASLSSSVSHVYRVLLGVLVRDFCTWAMITTEGNRLGLLVHNNSAVETELRKNTKVRLFYEDFIKTLERKISYQKIPQTMHTFSKDTEDMWVLAVPFRTASGKPRYCLCVRSTMKPEFTLSDGIFLSDALDRVIRQLQILTYQKKLELALRMKDQLYSIASHELKTPITSLKVYATLLDDPTLPADERNKYSQKVRQQSEKLVRLINEFFDAAQAAHKRLHYTIDTYILQDVVEQVVEDLSQIYPDFSIEIRGSIMREMQGDKGRISQVLNNLILNAIRYSGESRQVIITLLSTQTHASVEVCDFGIGINKENIQRIFNRYYQENKDSSRGMGIGLYLSRIIVHDHGGTIIVNSVVGKGTTFKVLLPFSY